MKICVFFGIALILSGKLIADEKEAGKAAEYFEAREYVKALDLYEVLLKQTLTPWERSVLQYNRGCVLFAEGNLSEAVVQWRAIPVSQDSFPLLTRRIHTNLAVAMLLQAKLTLDQTAVPAEKILSERSKSVEIFLTSDAGNPAGVVEAGRQKKIMEMDFSRVNFSAGTAVIQTTAFERARFFLQEALTYVRMAIEEECSLQQLEGAVTCLPEQDLNLLYTAIKSMYAKAAEQWQRFEQLYATPSQRLFLLLGSITLMQQRLHFLSGQPEETAPYRTLFVDEGKRWLPIWQSTEKEIHILKSQGSKLQALFSEAQRNYEDGLNDLKKEDYPESQKKLDKAFNQLMDLANQLGIKEPFATAVRRLLSSYQLALIEEPLQELTIAELLEEQKRLLEPFRSSMDSDQLSAFDLATKDLNLSLEALEKSMPLTGRFYFTEARYRLTKILRQAKRGSKLTPLEILANALDEQHQAVVLNRLAIRMEKSEKRDETMLERILKAQKAAAKAASPFLETVYLQQVSDFRQPGSLEESCQAQPWDEVLPLYERGNRAASEAAESSRPSLALQEETMHSWNSAMALLKKPKTAFKGTCKSGGGAGKPQDEGEGSAKKAPEEKPAVPMNRVLHNIQQMEDEDRKPQTAPSAPKGEKPW
ncbi:MAG: hypothetical protein LLG04_05655 [Parachlamydia sp.]|nr:hypothetical protein [Parachlamydia sp.]